MVFSSTVFLFLFFPGLLILYYLNKNRLWRNSVLLLFSFIFYAWGEPLFVFILVFYVLINWRLVLLLDKATRNKKKLLILIVSVDVFLLVVFKYGYFLAENLFALFKCNIEIYRMHLPIGISFFTFQLMSYVFDVYYKKAEPQKNPFYLALYISLFPQLIAGPIVRYQHIESEITLREENNNDKIYGMKRFVYGLSKKVLLANYLAQIADNAFDFFPEQIPSVMFVWYGAISYSLQIYFDFSGYSDMAIGLGRMFGFHFLENFNYPYISSSISDFWRRWHISLGTWFRDYVYIPLGGNQVNKTKWIRNLFIVWLLTGIWHGANWTFMIWGLYYFFFILFEKNTGLDKKHCILSHIWTLLIVVIGWVFFRSNNIIEGWKYVAAMFGNRTSGFIGYDFLEAFEGTYLVFGFAIIGATPLVCKVFSILDLKKHDWVESIWLIFIFMLSILAVVSSTYNPFIYFNF